MSREKFTTFVESSILSLAQDIKTLLRVVEDPDVDDKGRTLAAGALLHVLSGANAIPGLRGTLAWVDDVLVLRLALERVSATNPDALARHRDFAPELVDGLSAQLGVARAFLGDTMSVLERATDAMVKINHEGYTPAECVNDAEASRWLYDEINESVLYKLDFDADEVARSARQADQVLAQLKTRALAK